YRKAGLNVKERPELPAARQRIHDSAVIQQAFPLAERQLIQNGIDHAVRNMEARQSFLRRQVIAVLREERVAVVRADGAGVVNRTRPGVARQERQASAEPLLRLRTQAVVAGLAAAVHFLNASEFGVRRA